jgi:starch-binding outer membrane protein, SusD/RagB family
MMTIRRAVSRTCLGALLLAGAGCSDQFLKVTNPNVIDAATVDPTSGASTLAASAQQNFATAYGWLIMYGAWFTDESDVSDTFPTRNEFGFRVISDLNGSLNGDVWQPLSLATASTKIVLDLDLPNPTTNINLARAATFRGFSIEMMAETFCTGTLPKDAAEGGPELQTAALLDSAIYWFGQAIDVGTANGTADGKALANAALVGRARAKLQQGDKAGAAADAAAVPAGFEFDLTYTDDLSNRTRLSNRLWQFSFDRGSISVSEPYRLDDPRVPYLAPGESSLQPQDAVPGGFYVQQKYPAYNTSIRLASKLEADYIAAEASGDVAQQLALIAARRAANGQAAYAGPGDAASVLKELFFQRALDFYLEGKKLGDFRRNPSAVYAVPPTGAAYVKPGYVPIGSDTCFPIPRAERDNNPGMTS